MAVVLNEYGGTVGVSYFFFVIYTIKSIIILLTHRVEIYAPTTKSHPYVMIFYFYFLLML